MGRAPVTLDTLARRLGRYTEQTKQRLDKQDTRLLALEDLVRTNGLNGAAPVIKGLGPLVDAAEDLADMARAHKEGRELANASSLVAAAASRAEARKQARLQQEWLYRLTVRIRALMTDSGGKLWYAVLGAAGLYLVGQSWPHAEAFIGVLSHLGGPGPHLPHQP